MKVAVPAPMATPTIRGVPVEGGGDGGDGGPTRITKMSPLPLLLRLVVPKVAAPWKSPVTRYPPAPSEAMPLPTSCDEPPARTAQLMTPALVTRITKMSQPPPLPLLVR